MSLPFADQLGSEHEPEGVPLGRPQDAARASNRVLLRQSDQRHLLAKSVFGNFFETKPSLILDDHEVPNFSASRVNLV